MREGRQRYARNGALAVEGFDEALREIEFHADWTESDDVTRLVRPPWVSRYREPSDGRPEPAVELLGQPGGN